MANELEMAARLYAAKGGASINSQTWTTVANMTGRDMGQQTQDIGNSWESLDTPTDLALPYKLLLVNLDALQGVQMRFRDATTFPNYATPFLIPPGQFILIPQIISGVEVQLISTSGTVKVMTQYCEI
jgi:hypothetical protein